MQVLAALPEGGAPLALVVVQHLSPQHESVLPSLLAARSKLPVAQVTDGMQVSAGHVYVIPPNVQMAITDRVLHLSPRPHDRSEYTPIDLFFTSLADAAGSQAIGVVLSGTSSDGAAGLREIKAAGGITIAQRPDTARYDSMPRAAIATGAVDLVLTPEEIGKRLGELPQHPYLAPTMPLRGVPVTDEQLGKIFAILRRVTDVDFQRYKTPTVRRRLARRLALHRMADVDAYIRHLADNPSEAAALHQDFLIHVTRFFRDPPSFAALSDLVFPKLFEGRPPEVPLRVWVPGCATGEEAYSLAMMLLEHVATHAPRSRVQLFATDISEFALEQARAGVYPEGITADVTVDRLNRFFTRVDGGYRVSKPLRDACIFARHDLTRDPPFSKLDLIVCRNVLIYLDLSLQRQIVSTFHYALNPGGFLMLGPAETVGHQQLFMLVDKKWRLYRKSGVGTMVPLHRAAPPAVHHVAALRVQPDPVRREGRGILDDADRALLQRFSPPAVVVNAQFQIVHFRGQTGPFLEPAPGEPNMSVLKMAREGLLHPLRTALLQARRRRRPVRKEQVRVRSNGGWRDINLEVLPLGGASGTHFLVLFDEITDRRRGPRGGAPRKGAAPVRTESERVTALMRELAASREYLQSIIQELEATNEELQSANEEILSANEELQSTNEELDTAKEELQSTNEELNTVNEELHARNDELMRVNSDLVNLLAGVDMVVVIVGEDLRIRRFTPQAERVLNLLASDVGRPIGQINPNIVCPDLEALIRETVSTVTPREREVQDRQGRWYSLKIRPYKNVDNRIEGAVLALADLDSARQHRETLTLVREQLQMIAEAVSDPMMLIDEALHVSMVNEPFRRVFGGRQPAPDAPVLEGDGLWGTGPLRELIEEVRTSSDRPARRRIEFDLDGGSRQVDIVALPLRVADRDPWLLLIAREAANAQSV